MKEDPCTTCGSADSQEAICSCSKCGDRAHVWCMRTVLVPVPATWICDECKMRDSKISPKQVCGELSHPGPSAVPSERSRTQPKIKKKDTKLSKVKLLPASEAAVLLPNGTKNCSLPTHNTFRERHQHLQKRTPPVSKIGSSVKPSPPVKDFYQLTKDLRENRQSKVMGKKIAGTAKPFKPQVSLNIPGTAKPFKPQVSLNIPDKLMKSSDGLCKKEDKGREHELINEVQAKEMTIFEKFTKNPVWTRAIWCILSKEPRRTNPTVGSNVIFSGQFEILNGPDHGVYSGLQAYAPCLIHRKAYFFSLMLPSSLSFNLFCRNDLWGKFKYVPPDEEDVSLYILPGNMDRYEHPYKHLVEMLDSHDQAMHANIDGVELIVFTSRWLEVDCKENFLWGSYSCESKYAATKKESGIAPVVYGEDADMELDMVDGEWVGPEEVIVTKEIKAGAEQTAKIGIGRSGRLHETEKRVIEEHLEFPPGFEQHCHLKKRKADAAASY